jgi:hypothetical protein
MIDPVPVVYTLDNRGGTMTNEIGGGFRKFRLLAGYSLNDGSHPWNLKTGKTILILLRQRIQTTFPLHDKLQLLPGF